MGVWREDEIGGKGEEVLECVGKRMFQNRKCCLQEVGGRKGKVRRFFVCKIKQWRKCIFNLNNCNLFFLILFIVLVTCPIKNEQVGYSL